MVLLVAGVLGYAAFQPKYHLRSQMPRDFIEISDAMPADKRAAEEQIARAYWQCAVTQVQWMYGYGHRLPEKPPAEFAVHSAAPGNSASAPATRDRYWRRLQRVWYLPTTWEESYGWDLQTMTRSLESGVKWVEKKIQNLTSLAH